MKLEEFFLDDKVAFVFISGDGECDGCTIGAYAVPQTAFTFRKDSFEQEFPGHRPMWLSMRMFARGTEITPELLFACIKGALLDAQILVKESEALGAIFVKHPHEALTKLQGSL